MEVGSMDYGFHEWTTERKSDFRTNVKLAAKYGYKCMELLQLSVDKYLEAHTLHDMKSLLEEYSLKPSALSALIGFNMLEGDENVSRFAEFKRLACICERIGCDTLVLVPTRHREGWDEQRIKEDAISVLKRYSDIAQEYGIRLSVEFLGFGWASINKLEKLVDILCDVDRDNVGITFDCFHFYANGSNMDALIDLDGSRIFALHINDCPGSIPIGTFEDDSKRCMPGDGQMPLEEIFTVLNNIGCNVTPCLELFNEEIWEMDPEKAIGLGSEKIKDFFLNEM